MSSCDTGAGKPPQFNKRQEGEMAATKATEIKGSGHPILDKTICLVIHRGKWGIHRKASMGKVTVKANKDLLSLSKKLVDSKEYTAIESLYRDVRVFLEGLALPSMFKNGSYAIPIPLVEPVEEKMQAFKAELEPLVAAFLAVYPAKKNEIAAALGDLYDPRDYPSVARVAEKFYMDWSYVDYGVPGRLRAIKASIFEAEREKMAAKLTSAVDDARQALRGGMLTLVEHMADRLAAPDVKDGKTKKKIFRNTLVDHMSAFLNVFEMRNVTDDAELAKLVKQARGLLQGVDAKVLRDDDLTRQKLADGFAKIKATLEPITVEKGTRQIDLDD